MSPPGDREYPLGRAKGKGKIQDKRSLHTQLGSFLISAKGDKRKCVTVTKLKSSYLQWLCEYEGESPVEHMFQNGNTGCLNWINMAATSPPAPPTQLHSPAALGLPHKAAGTGTNRLFIVQQKQVGMQSSQAANIDKERGRDGPKHSRKIWTRAGVQHLGHYTST